MDVGRRRRRGMRGVCVSGGGVVVIMYSQARALGSLAAINGLLLAFRCFVSYSILHAQVSVKAVPAIYTCQNTVRS